MGSTQNKVIAKLKEIAEAAKVDADFEWRFSNVGHLYLRRGFETVANVALDFQSDSMSAALNRGAAQAGGYGTTHFRAYIRYNDPAAEFEALFAAIKGAIAPTAAPKVRAPRRRKSV